MSPDLLLVSVLNFTIMAMYLSTGFISYHCLKALREHHDYKVTDIFKIIREMRWMAGTKHKGDIKRDGLGWVGVYLGTALVGASCVIFALMHVDYFFSQDIQQVGIQDTYGWLAAHTLSITGTLAMWYAIFKERIGSSNEDDT